MEVSVCVLVQVRAQEAELVRICVFPFCLLLYVLTTSWFIYILS